MGILKTLEVLPAIKMNKLILIIVGILLVAGVFFVYSGKLDLVKHEEISSENAVRIPLAEISENAKWYEQNVGGAEVRFFAVKAGDGTIKTAFDACDVCYSEGRGYRQEGGYMICNNCGNRYLIESLGTENIQGGGCWPGYLPSEIGEENLIIKKPNIEEGKGRFS